RLDAFLEGVRPLAVIGVDGARETVLHGVGRAQGVRDAIDLHQVDGGSEDLVLELSHARFDVLPHRRPTVEGGVRVAYETHGLAAFADAAVAMQERRAVFLAP